MPTSLTCHYCGTLNQLPAEQDANLGCGECGSTIWKNSRVGLSWTMALTSAALILYVPANTFPILSVTRLGQYSENTIISGVSELFHNGMWGIATVVFLASVIIPLVKIFCLFYLCWSTAHPSHKRFATHVYKVVHTIGPWSMLDVFVVAILVSLVQLRDLANVTPGPGLVAFTAVVVLTTLASQLFDPRYIWRASGRRELKPRGSVH